MNKKDLENILFLYTVFLMDNKALCLISNGIEDQFYSSLIDEISKGYHRMASNLENKYGQELKTILGDVSLKDYTEKKLNQFFDLRIKDFGYKEKFYVS